MGLGGSSESSSSSSAMSAPEYDTVEKLGGSPNGFLDKLTTVVKKHSGGKNVVLCPMSVFGPIAFLLPGAKSTTRQALVSSIYDKTATFTDKGAEDAARAMYQVCDSLSGAVNLDSGGTAEFSMATRVLVKTGFALTKEYKHLLLDRIAEIDPSDAAAAASSVNTWVSDQTGGQISSLVTEEDFGDLFRVALISAVYFKGKFVNPFDPAETVADTPFFPSREAAMMGASEENPPVCGCAMMKAEGIEQMYCETDSFQLVRLDYATDKLGLVLALPKHDGAEMLKRDELMFLDFQPTKLNLSLPRFKFEFEVLLNDILSELGLSELFSDKCDLSGMLSSEDPLYVSKITHRAVIEVNEEGTTASAGTAAVIKTRSMPERMNLNSPFDFFIVQNSMSLVLFAGHVANPGPSA